MQSRLMSLVEGLVNVVIGYGVAVVTQLMVFPHFGLSVGLTDNLLIGLIFTLVSLGRCFALRRVFNHLSTRDRS